MTEIYSKSLIDHPSTQENVFILNPILKKIKISFVQNGLQQNLELKKIFHHKLLSNFTNCNSYEFSISSNATATDFIVYLLEFQPISGSSNVVIGSSFLPAELPVETIANWLDRPIKRAQKVRPNFLRLRMNLILNPVEIFNHLKEVGNFALFSCTFICKNFYSCYVIVQKLCTSSEPENMLMRSFGFKHANYKNYYHLIKIHFFLVSSNKRGSELEFIELPKRHG